MAARLKPQKNEIRLENRVCFFMLNVGWVVCLIATKRYHLLSDVNGIQRANVHDREIRSGKFLSNQYSFITRNTLSLLNIFPFWSSKMPIKCIFLEERYESAGFCCCYCCVYVCVFPLVKSLSPMSIPSIFFFQTLCINHSWLSAKKTGIQFVDAQKSSFLRLKISSS